MVFVMMSQNKMFIINDVRTQITVNIKIELMFNS